VKASSSLKVIPSPSEFVQLMLFNDYEAPTNNVDFRRAVADAINIPLLIKTVLDGFAAPVKETLVPGVFGYNAHEPGYTYNPKAARALLKAAHYHGQSVTILTSPVFSTTLLQAIQSELTAVGINAKIQSYATPTYLSTWQNPKHDWGNLNVTDWSCSCEDASGLLTPLYTTGSIWSSFNNPALNSAINAAQSTVNTAARLKDIDTALSLIQSQMAGMGLWQSYAIYGANADLEWTPDLPQDMFINTMKWK
jgi:peptide/nickel transport system substrate-binding protein